MSEKIYTGKISFKKSYFQKVNFQKLISNLTKNETDYIFLKIMLSKKIILKYIILIISEKLHGKNGFVKHLKIQVDMKIILLNASRCFKYQIYLQSVKDVSSLLKMNISLLFTYQKVPIFTRRVYALYSTYIIQENNFVGSLK